MELNFIRSQDEARSIAELMAENAARLAKESLDFATRVRQPGRQAANSRQDRANALLDNKRPAVDTRIRPGSIVMLQDQRKVKRKWDPLNYGLWLVERQGARTKLFVLRNISTGKYLERHVPQHHLSLVKDTNGKSDVHWCLCAPHGPKIEGLRAVCMWQLMKFILFYSNKPPKM
jgi:hypothetical protein